MELEDLVGLHVLAGVDYGTEKDASQYGESNTVSFILDGKCYTAIEYPEDGYRSMMKKIIVDEDWKRVKNIFPHPVIVLARMRQNEHRTDCDILELVDAINGKIVLSVGTDYSDDYYPTFIYEFAPENMHVNEDR